MSEPVALFPAPRIEQPPETWPAMTLYAATVLLEAEAEPEDGQLAVAYVIRTRMDQGHADPSAVILKPAQFSCWASDYSGMRRARLTAPDSKLWAACWRAACVAFWRLLADPSGSADHYLNPTLTRASRPLHDLPAWYDPDRVTARIGNHEFLRLA